MNTLTTLTRAMKRVASVAEGQLQGAPPSKQLKTSPAENAENALETPPPTCGSDTDCESREELKELKKLFRASIEVHEGLKERFSALKERFSAFREVHEAEMLSRKKKQYNLLGQKKVLERKYKACMQGLEVKVEALTVANGRMAIANSDLGVKINDLETANSDLQKDTQQLRLELQLHKEKPAQVNDFQPADVHTQYLKQQGLLDPVSLLLEDYNSMSKELGRAQERQNITEQLYRGEQANFQAIKTRSENQQRELETLWAEAKEIRKKNIQLAKELHGLKSEAEGVKKRYNLYRQVVEQAVHIFDRDSGDSSAGTDDD